MKAKKILLSGFILTFLTTPVLAEKHSLSLGYATGFLSADGYASGDNGHPDGMNFKYRYEFTDQWGVIGSFTFAGDVLGSGVPVKVEWNYTSYMVGPSWRFNDFVSIYYLMGLARADTHVTTSSVMKYKKNAYAGSLGVQINPWPNVVFDVGYEGARFNSYPGKGTDIDSGLFTLGVGYRF
ncbi:TPA: outer membrane beta-barrel protein [Salmonella enterica subsp. enterica serovar Muenchen]|nr:outer membrane beta-barrel protein [Salmonella enterica subsp. enterica serovar Muenchen]HEC8861214.1 outer membrane beta-barrel protein [Salmonella enterica subsp. enterica serovar Muenchen]